MYIHRERERGQQSSTNASYTINLYLDISCKRPMKGEKKRLGEIW